MNGMPDLSEAFGVNAPLRQAKSDHIQICDDVVNVLIYLVGLWRALVPPYSALRSASPALVSLAWRTEEEVEPTGQRENVLSC